MSGVLQLVRDDVEPESRPCFCGKPRQGIVPDRAVDGGVVAAHLCRQCPEHCQIEIAIVGRARAAAAVAEHRAPPGMVAIGSTWCVDPNEVQVIEGRGAGTRIYLKPFDRHGETRVAPGRGFFFDVDLSLPDVMKAFTTTR